MYTLHSASPNYEHSTEHHISLLDTYILLVSHSHSHR